MPGGDEQDYRVFIGAEAFDPKDVAARSRRRAAAARRRRAARAGDIGALTRAEGAPEPIIVQFERPLTTPDIERLRGDYDLRLDRFLPNLAFLEMLAPQTLERVRQDFLVRETIPLDPALKLAPTTQGDVDLFDAALVDEADPGSVETALAATGATDVAVRDDRPAGGSLTVRFVLDDQARLPEVADIEEVLWIEPVGEDTADNVEAAHTIQTATLDGHPIWDRGIHGEGQVIGVLDTGPPDVAHCFFAGPAPNTPGPGHRKLAAVRNASPPAPLNGHATFVAGIAAGDDRSLPGSSARRGGAWAARLVCGNRRDVNLPGNSLLNELTLAQAAGAIIHSNSWHRNTNPAALPARGLPAIYGLLDRDVDNFTFANEEHLVVGSAGNAGEELGPPGTAKNALCVGAAQAEPNEMNLGDGNPGPTGDGRRKPDLMAVGCGIQSAIVSTPCVTGTRNPCASSYATPHAAAAAALVRQYFLDGWYPSGEKRAADSVRPTGALLKAILLNSTQDMTGVGVAGYPSNAEGWGLIRLDRTLFFRGARRRLRVWDVRHANGARPGVAFHPHDFDVAEDSEQLKVTLVWSDPGSVFPVFFAGPSLVNDLDLEVTAPGGTKYVGNDFAGGVSRPNGTNRDALNNVEMVIVNNPPPGRWQLLVHGVVNVGNPGQGYALVATAHMKSKCFVASAVYGDDAHPDVRLIRSWRDRSLARGGARAAAMRGLAGTYDKVGPPMGEAVRRHPRAARLLRTWVFRPAAATARRRRERAARGRRD